MRPCSAETVVNWRSILGFKAGRPRMRYVEFGMVFEQAHAAVPAQDAVVVSDRADFLRFGKIAKGIFHKRQENVRRAAYPKLRFRAPLEQQTGVIKALVRIA